VACKARCPGDPAPECGTEQRETLRSLLAKIRKYNYRGVPFVRPSVRPSGRCMRACVLRAYYNPSPHHHPFWLQLLARAPCCLLKEGPVAPSRGGPWEGYCCSCRRHLLVIMLACIAYYNTPHTTALYNTASRPLLHTLLATSPHYYCSLIIMMCWMGS